MDDRNANHPSINESWFLAMEPPLPYPMMIYIELKLRMRFSGVFADKILTLGRQSRDPRFPECHCTRISRASFNAPQPKIINVSARICKNYCLPPWTRKDWRDGETHFPDTDDPLIIQSANAPMGRVYFPISSQYSQLSWKFLCFLLQKDNESKTKSDIYRAQRR